MPSLCRPISDEPVQQGKTCQHVAQRDQLSLLLAGKDQALLDRFHRDVACADQDANGISQESPCYLFHFGRHRGRKESPESRSKKTEAIERSHLCCSLDVSH